MPIQNLMILDTSKTFTKFFFSFSQSFSIKSSLMMDVEISSKFVLSNWEYSNHIQMPKLNENVGLLFGSVAVA